MNDNHLIVRINASFDLPIKYQLHKLILQSTNTCVESFSHLSHISRQIWTEILQEMSHYIKLHLPVYTQICSTNNAHQMAFWIEITRLDMTQ